jgi:large subunit ribosomal protein L31
VAITTFRAPPTKSRPGRPLNRNSGAGVGVPSSFGEPASGLADWTIGAHAPEPPPGSGSRLCGDHNRSGRPGGQQKGTQDMKQGIHPEYVVTQVTCSCGNTFTTRSTAKSGQLHADVCSACHPFYTGKQKIMDVGGRVDKFEKRYGKRVRNSADN